MAEAVRRPLAEHVEGAPGDPDEPHAVMDPTRAEPLLSDAEALALAAEQHVGADPDVLVEDLRVPGVNAL